MTKSEKKQPQPTPPQEPPCKHDWQYNTDTKQHECSKCHIPAPPDWNEVGF